MSKKNKKRIFRAGIVCLAAAVGIGLLAGATTTEEPVQEDVKPVVVVDTQAPRNGSLAVSREFIATVEPNEQLTVYPKVSAEVLSVNFNVGDTVQAGDVLFQMDSKALQLSISQSQAAVASAQNRAEYNVAVAEKDLETYNYNMDNGYDTGLLSAQNAVENAEANVKAMENRLQTATASLTSARRSLREHRDKDEWDFGGSEATYDQMMDQYRDAVIQGEIAVEGAQIALDNAKDGLEQAKSALETTEKLTEERAVNVQDALEAAKLNTDFSDQYIAIEKLRNDLDYYTVRAAISGVIEQRNIDPYEMATPQSPAFVISNKDAMTVTFQVSENVVASMQPGDAVLVEKQGVAWPGTIFEISTMVNVRGGLYTVKASVENAPFDMHTGATIKVIADTKKAENAMLLPVEAVYFDDGDAFVYIYGDGAVQKTPVEVGISDNESIQILSGLSAASNVVTTWNSSLRDGLEVVHVDDVAAMELAEDASEPASELDDIDLTDNSADATQADTAAESEPPPSAGDEEVTE